MQTLNRRDNKYTRAARFFERLASLGLSATEVDTLRLAEKRIHRWAELECGGGNDHASWGIERDETTGKPYMVTYPHNGKERRNRIADREAGALKRIRAIMERHPDLWFYHQTDPRGAALYVGRHRDIEADLITDEAKRHGLKLEMLARPISGDVPRAAVYGTAQLPGRKFDCPEQVAVAYLKQIGKEVPKSRNLPLDSCYSSRGVACCVD